MSFIYDGRVSKLEIAVVNKTHAPQPNLLVPNTSRASGCGPGLMMTMSMLKQASSKSWLSSKLWLLEFEIVIRGEVCEKLE